MAAGHLSVDACAGIWPVYKILAHLDLRTAGGIATASTLAGNGLQLAFGPLADRGHRRLLVATGVAAAGAVCFFPYAGSPAALLALVLVASIGSAAFHPAGAGHAGTVRTHRSGLAVALFLAGGYLGFAASQLAYAGAFRALDGRLAPFFVLPLALGAALLLARRGVGGRGTVPCAPPAHGPVPWGKLAWLFAIQGLSAAIGVSVQFLTPELFGGGGGTLAMGGAHCLATLAGAAALVPAGWARDRFGARRVLLVANLLAAISLGLLALFAGRGPGLLLFLLLAFNFANAANTVVALAEGTRGLSHAGSSVSALLMGLPWLVSAPAPSLAGYLADPGRGGTPAMALAIIGTCSPLAALAALFLPRLPAPFRRS
jgi:FSR family fosmidomycin resistance protein-like MFS transporter